MVKEYGLTRFKSGECAPIPIMSGYTKDEFIINGVNSVEKAVISAFSTAQANGRKEDLYYYRFAPSVPGFDNPGAFHSCDLWFFFETVGKCWRPYKGAHYDLARKMCNYFANFIKTGDPNGKDADGTDMPEWKPFTADEHNEMLFSEI